MPDTSLPVEPVRAEDPKKKKEVEKNEKLDGKDNKDASKSKEGEGEELVRELFTTISLLSDTGYLVGGRPPASQ